MKTSGRVATGGSRLASSSPSQRYERDRPSLSAPRLSGSPQIRWGPALRVRVPGQHPCVAERRISALILDEHNLAEIARHGVSGAEVLQVIWNCHLTARNPRGEPEGILLIGETDGGRVLTIPLAPTDDPSTWRPATAFDASRDQRSLFRGRADRSS